MLAPNLFVYLAEVLHPIPQGAGGGFQSVPVGILGATEPGGGFGARMVPNIPEYKRIGESLEALLWAVVGGWVACYFALPREPVNDDAQAAPPDTAPEAGRQANEQEVSHLTSDH